MATPLRNGYKQPLSETPGSQRLALVELEELLDKENYSPMLKTWKSSVTEASAKEQKQKLKPSLSQQQRSTSSQRQTAIFSESSAVVVETEASSPLPSNDYRLPQSIVDSPTIASPLKTPSYVAERTLLDTLESRIGELQSELAEMYDYRRNYTDLANRYYELQSRHDQLEVESCGQKEENARSKETILDLQIRVDSLQKKCQELETFLREHNQTLADKHTLADSNKELRLRLKQVVEDYHQVVVDKDQMHKQIQELKLEKYGAEGEDSKEALQIKLRSLESQLVEEEAARAVLKSECESMFQDYERLCDEVDTLQSENVALKRSMVSTTTEQESATQLVVGIVQDIVTNTVHAAEARSAEQVICDLQSMNQELLQNMETCSKKIHELEGQLGKQRNSTPPTGDKDKEILKLRARLMEKDRDDEELVQFLQEERSIRSQLLEEAEMKVAALMEDLSQANDHLFTERQDMSRMSTRVKMVEQERDDFNLKMMALKEDLVHATEECQKMEREAKSLTTELQVVTVQRDQLQAQKSGLEQQVKHIQEKAQGKISLLKQNLSKAQSEVDELDMIVDFTRSVLLKHVDVLHEHPEILELVNFLDRKKKDDE